MIGSPPSKPPRRKRRRAQNKHGEGVGGRNMKRAEGEASEHLDNGQRFRAEGFEALLHALHIVVPPAGELGAAERWTQPGCSAASAHLVPFPAPGPPGTKITCGEGQ